MSASRRPGVLVPADRDLSLAKRALDVVVAALACVC